MLAGLRRALLLCLLVGCSAEQRPSALAVDSWRLDAEPDVTLDASDGDPNFIFSRIAAVRLLPNGGVAVADGSSNTIRIFEDDGSFLTQVGREGQGPGEFRYINGMWLKHPDTLLVYDGDNQRLTGVLASGVLVEPSITFRASTGRPEVYLGELESGNHVMAWIRQAGRDEARITPDLMEFGTFSPSGDYLDLLGTDFGMRRLASPIPFSPHFLGTVVGNTVIHTDGLNGMLRRTLESGESQPPMTVSIDVRDATDAFSALEAAIDTAARRRLSEVRGHPGTDTIPHFSDIIAEGDHRVWIKLYDPAADSHWLGRARNGGSWLALDSDGAPIAELSLPASFRLMDVLGDRVAGVVRDELGVERVEVHTILKGSAS